MERIRKGKGLPALLLPPLLSAWAMAAGQMAVVAGATEYKAARTAALELEECCAEALQRHQPPLEAHIREMEGTWLVEVGPLRSTPDSPDPLIGQLAQHYPHLMLVAPPAAKASGAAPAEPERNLLGLPGRLEWWALGLLALVGLLGFGVRRRHLGRIGKEQTTMQQRQKSMEKQLKEEGKL